MSESNTTTPPAMESIDKFVNWAVNTAQVEGPKVVDWLYSEVPEVVEQFLTWHFVQSLMNFCVCLFFICIFPFLLMHIAKRIYTRVEVNKLPECDRCNFWVPCIFAHVILIAASQITSWTSINLIWLKIWFAPKVFLLEAFTDVVK
jgi:hypothetical protein